MGKAKPGSDAGQPDDLSDALVSLYLTEETGLPCNIKEYEMTSLKAPDPAGTPVERPALRVTFDKKTSITQQRHLLTFGSDDQRCNIVLNATEASPVHCKVYAQLNSGLNVWVIEDNSSHGTEYLDDESRRNCIAKKVIERKVAAHGLYGIKIGRNVFKFSPPSDDREISQRERWFQDLDPMLVTRNVLQEQLCGAAESYCPICRLGHGAMGAVFQYMELTTGLMIAVKEEEVKNKEADERVQREIGYMQSLKHPNLVEYIASNPTTNAGVKKWFTAMPLYQGRLCDILPLETSAIEEVMLQLFDGVNYMHGQRVLHKDIKPENVLVKAKSRPDVVLADFGLCASLNNQAELMVTSGTPGFVAPEISRMIVQTLAVDVFALGATLFTILEPERCKGPHATIATLGNVARRPPKVYGGLVQSMMAHDPRERPSLKECFDIVKARQRDWKKRTPLALMPSSVLSASGPARSQRTQRPVVQESPINKLANFTARKHGLARVAENRQPRYRPREQHETARPNFNARDHIGRMQGPRALNPPIAPVREPRAPAPVQQVDFSVPPPPISTNPFARLDRGSASNIAPPARRQAVPETHEPPRTPIRKPDNEIKRMIRRGGERRKFIERWHNIRVQKNKICDGAGDLTSGTPLNRIRGLCDMTAGGLGFTGECLGLIFTNLAVAMPALRHIGQAGGFGLNTNKRLMYGMKSQGVWPMTPEEYDAERLQSESNFLNTTEGRRYQARLDAAAEHWRRERDRARDAERESEILERP